MMQEKVISLELEVDYDSQWFTPIWVAIGNKKILVRFKIDTGCNALVLSHSTLSRFGLSTDKTTLSKLPDVPGTLASGETHTFKNLGNVSLSQGGTKPLLICKANAICHAMYQTNDLLGTEVLRKFDGILFRLSGNKRMELHLP